MAVASGTSSTVRARTIASPRTRASASSARLARTPPIAARRALRPARFPAHRTPPPLRRRPERLPREAWHHDAAAEAPARRRCRAPRPPAAAPAPAPAKARAPPCPTPAPHPTRKPPRSPASRAIARAAPASTRRKMSRGRVRPLPPTLTGKARSATKCRNRLAVAFGPTSRSRTASSSSARVEIRFTALSRRAQACVYLSLVDAGPNRPPPRLVDRRRVRSRCARYSSSEQKLWPCA